MKRRILMFTALLCASASTARAQVLDVHGTYTQNVAPSQIPWGGGQTGYDMRTLVEDGPYLAMAVQRRPDAPNVTDNGNGTWTVFAGHDPMTAGPNVTLWNVAFYIGSRNLSNFVYELYYDFNPAANTDVQQFGAMTVPRACNPTCFATLDHTNLGFGNLSTVGGNTFKVPSVPFDVNALGEYTFALAAFTKPPGGGDGELVDYVAIKVNTVSAVPEPGTYALMAAGLFVTGLAARRRKRTTTTLA